MTRDEFERALGRIEGKLDTILAQLEDHEPRLRSLELSRAKLRGAIMTLGTFCGAVGAGVAAGVAKFINYLQG